MPGPLLSVVVIGRDEGERLKRCLDSIRAMRVPEGGIELIYVDSGSCDGSIKVAGKAGAKVVALRSGQFTAGRSRNEGWRKAAAPFVFFVDGDTVVNPEFAVAALPKLDDPRLAATFGWTRELTPRKSIFHRMLDIQWQAYGVGRVDTCMGTAVFRKSVLEEIGGFDPAMTGSEEGELCGRIRRLGYLIEGIDHPMILHELTLNRWRQYWWRMWRNSYGITETVDRFPADEMKELRYRWRHTIVWGSLLILLLVIALVSSVAFRTPAPLAALLVFFAGLVIHTAWKSRGREGGPLSLLAFGFHRYVKELPRLAGLISYYRDKRRGTRSFVDYKAAACTVRRAEEAESR